MSFIVGLVISLFILWMLGLMIGSVIYIGPICAALFIVFGGYAYMAIASLWFDVPDSLKVGENVVFWFAIFLIVGGFGLMSAEPARRTKSGKADKRFKKREPSEKDVSFGVSTMFTAILVFGIRWLFDKFDLVAKTIAFFN